MTELDEDVFEEGLGFDGSSIRGFQTIDESDMLLMPDAAHGADRPLHGGPDAGPDLRRQGPDHAARPTAATRATSRRRSRPTSRSSGVADTIYIGPELEFFIFDSVRFDQSYNYGFYYIDSEAGFWNSGA